MKSAIPTARWDSAFFVNINFVNFAFLNWSSFLNLGLITFWVCEIIKMSVCYFDYFTNRFISVFIGQNVPFGTFKGTFLFFNLNGFISAFVPHIGSTLSAFLPV